MESELYKREYSLTEIFKAATNIYVDNAAAIISIILLISVPVSILNTLAGEMLSIDWMRDPTIPPEEYSALFAENISEVLTSFLTLAVISIALSFISLLSSIALAIYVKSCADGKKTGLSEAYVQAFGRWPAAVWTSILMGILLFILFLLIIVPGIVYWIYWVFAINAVALSAKSGKDALDHSKKLVRGRWWNVLGYVVVFGITGFVLAIPIIVLIGILRLGLTDPASGLAIDTLGAILFSVVNSFPAVLQTVLYLNYEATAGRRDKG